MKKIILLLFGALCLGPGLHSQVWIQQGAGFAETRDILNFFPVNDQVVWASASSSRDLTVTTDGGNTWTPKTIPDLPGLSNAMVCAIDSNTAWVALFKKSGTTNGGIYKTTDGGNTWTRQETATFSGTTSWPDIIHFWNADTGVCVGDIIDGEFEIYTTTDGGSNWIRVPGSQIPDPVSGEVGTNYALYSVAGSSIWYVSYPNGRVFRSSDFGNNWTAAVTSSGIMASSWGCPIAFKDPDHGLVMSARINPTPIPMDFSDDGGLTFSPKTYSGDFYNWQLTNVPGTEGTYASAGCYINHAGLTFTNDDGATWISEPNIINTRLFTSAWINDSIGWAGGTCTGPTNGIYKFNNVLALVSDFSSDNTAIVMGETVQFENLSKGRFTEYQWTFEGGDPATSDQKIPPPVAYNAMGEFDVTLVVMGELGSDTMVKAAYIKVYGVGIDGMTNDKLQMTNWPNPFTLSTTFSFSLTEASDVTLKVYNGIGTIMKSVSLGMRSRGSHTVDWNSQGLPAGIYYYRLQAGNRVGSGKLVKL